MLGRPILYIFSQSNIPQAASIPCDNQNNNKVQTIYSGYQLKQWDDEKERDENGKRKHAIQKALYGRVP